MHTIIPGRVLLLLGVLLLGLSRASIAMESGAPDPAAAIAALQNPAVGLNEAARQALLNAWRQYVQALLVQELRGADSEIGTSLVTGTLDGRPYLHFRARANNGDYWEDPRRQVTVEVLFNASRPGMQRRYGHQFEPATLDGRSIQPMQSLMGILIRFPL